MTIRAITRKGGCIYCTNTSTHNKNCRWAYVPEPNSKAWKLKPWKDVYRIVPIDEPVRMCVFCKKADSIQGGNICVSCSRDYMF
jgi:hypothetical protein